MNPWLRFVSVVDRLNRGVARLCRWLVLVMLGLGVWNVVGRHLGLLVGRNLSSNSLIEAQWYAFSVLFLLGAGYTLQRQGHVRVDVVHARLSRPRRARLEVLGTVFFLIPFCLVMIAVAWNTVAFSWQLGELSPDPGGLPRFPIKAMIPLGFLLLLLQGLAEAIRNLPACRPEVTPAAETGEGSDGP